ncbi:hypothetical protein GP2_031_00230 [Gordonia paraffinivorans NBRC 108238]|uniref:DUF8175 domain-containing protein n=1 Tax=Gordonia paraffinivorans NBRC 108238 TaxID=1223543 RepID=A0ABQ0INS4_9ACTN|nr:hypothetical protein GP2_031_00230 [Gordonia paraffinivorans NBRC 108238]
MALPGLTESETPTRRAWWKRPRVWATSVVVIVVVTSIAGVALLSDDEDNSQPRVAVPPPVSQEPSEPLPDGGPYTGSDVDVIGRGMRVPADPNGHVLEQTVRTSSPRLTQPISAPQGLEWQKVYGVPMPFSTSDGPTTISAEGVPSGFSRTPQGAALATLQILMRITYGPREVRQAVLDSSVIGSAELKNIVLNAPSEAQYQTVPAAVQILEDRYTEDSASVRWMFGPFPAPEEFPTTNGTVYHGGAIPAIWENGRWKVKLTEAVVSSELRDFEEYLDDPRWATTWF